jgi:hypothetical protein
LTFLLQTHEDRTNHGPIVQLEASQHLITQEYVLNKYGSGYFCVKQNSPQIHTVWKGWVGERSENKLDDNRSVKFARLERKTDNLGVLLAMLGIGTAAAHGVTAWNFVAHGERLNRIEAILAASPLTSLQAQYVCRSCYRSPFSLFDKFCGHCGVKITWADGSRLSLPNIETQCSKCRASVQANQAYCTECGAAFSNPNSDPIQRSRWRLPQP